MPTPLIGRVTFWPATVTSPVVAGSRPVTSFMIVDLPQPDGPTTATNSPLLDVHGGIGQGERRLLAETVGEADGLEVDERHAVAEAQPSEPLFLRARTMSDSGEPRSEREITSRPSDRPWAAGTCW